MPVKVVLPPMLQSLAGNMTQFETAGDTIGSCLQNLVKRYPAIAPKLFTGGKLVNGVNVFLNGQNVAKDILARPVRDGDTIHISFIVLGG